MSSASGPRLNLGQFRDTRIADSASVHNSTIAVAELKALSDIDELLRPEDLEPALLDRQTFSTGSAPDDLRLPAPSMLAASSDARFQALKSFVRKFEGRRDLCSTEEQRAGVLLSGIHDLETKIRALMIKSERV